MRRFVFTFAVVVNLLLADQIAKEAAVRLLKASSAVALLPVFNLAYVENRGCAWGMLQGRVWPLAAFGFVALALLIRYRRGIFPAGRLGFWTESLLYAGVIGNLLDRLFRGFVVDFLDFHWGMHHFPCFNVADICISVAAGLLILAGFVEKRGRAG